MIPASLSPYDRVVLLIAGVFGLAGGLAGGTFVGVFIFINGSGGVGGVIAGAISAVFLGGFVGFSVGLVVGIFLGIPVLEAVRQGRSARSATAVRSRARHGWRIAVLAGCMAPAARYRWLDLVAETLHDFEATQHPALLADFRRTAPVVILRSWTIDYTRSGVSR